jgi:hypothetical protein
MRGAGPTADDNGLIRVTVRRLEFYGGLCYGARTQLGVDRQIYTRVGHCINLDTELYSENIKGELIGKLD